jgi:hypothetical protein
MLHLWEIGRELGVLEIIYNGVLGNWVTSLEESWPYPAPLL